MIRILFFLLLAGSAFSQGPPLQSANPLRVVVLGCTRSEVHQLLENPSAFGLEVSAIWDPDTALVGQLARQYGLPQRKPFDSPEDVLKKLQPAAAICLGATSAHLELVRACAKKEVDVLLGAPLASTYAEATEIQALAQKHQIQVLTAHPIALYGSTQQGYRLLMQGQLGQVERFQGISYQATPADTSGNGIFDRAAGALSLSVWFLKGGRAEKVMALGQTAVVTFPDVEGAYTLSDAIKPPAEEFHLFGAAGAVFCLDVENMRMITDKHPTDVKIPAPRVKAPRDHVFSYFAAVAKDQLTPFAFDPMSLETNLEVTKIIEALALSARTGQVVFLSNH